MGHTRPGVWTAERIAVFNEIHNEMPKAIWQAVNALPGPAVTKSAVIGRRDRAHGMVRRPIRTQEEIAASLLARRDRENKKQRDKRAVNSGKNVVNFNRVEAAKARAAKGGDPGPYVCIEAKDIAPLNLSLLDLQEGDCRWPYDAPAGSSISHVFCGHPSIEGKPYCKGHTAIATTGLPSRKAMANPGEFGKSRGGVFGRVT